MLLWIALTLMTAFAAVWVSAPFLRRLDDRVLPGNTDVEVYRDQLREVEREHLAGAIDADQAASAQTEIKRRLLSVDTGRSFMYVLTQGQQHLSVLIVTGIVVLASVILYANTGRPDLPSAPRPSTALVLGGEGGTPTFRPIQPGQSSPTNRAAPPLEQAGGLPIPNAPSLGSVDDMIERVRDRLAKEPNNAELWRMIGWSYFSTERYAEAVEAYTKAASLQPKNPDIQTAYGEAIVRAANGAVNQMAAAAFDAALAISPRDPKARYFKGLLLEQSGDRNGALNIWKEILASARPDDAWAADLRSNILRLASELGIDGTVLGLPQAAAPSSKAPTVGGVLQALKEDSGQAAPVSVPAPGRGPTEADIKAANSLSPSDRTQMIKSMVAKLASRLESSPRDADGWLQLIRSQRILGEMEAARVSLGKAIAAFNDLPQEQSRIAAAAAELGITKP